MYSITLSNIYARSRSRVGIFGIIGDAIETRRQRRCLAGLSDHQLNDIGVSREEAEKEAKRPIWDAIRQ